MPCFAYSSQQPAAVLPKPNYYLGFTNSCYLDGAFATLLYYGKTTSLLQI